MQLWKEILMFGPYIPNLESFATRNINNQDECMLLDQFLSWNHHHHQLPRFTVAARGVSRIRSSRDRNCDLFCISRWSCVFGKPVICSYLCQGFLAYGFLLVRNRICFWIAEFGSLVMWEMNFKCWDTQKLLIGPDLVMFKMFWFVSRNLQSIFSSSSGSTFCSDWLERLERLVRLERLALDLVRLLACGTFSLWKPFLTSFLRKFIQMDSSFWVSTALRKPDCTL